VNRHHGFNCGTANQEDVVPELSKLFEAATTICGAEEP